MAIGIGTILSGLWKIIQCGWGIKKNVKNMSRNKEDRSTMEKSMARVSSLIHDVRDGVTTEMTEKAPFALLGAAAESLERNTNSNLLTRREGTHNMITDFVGAEGENKDIARMKSDNLRDMMEANLATNALDLATTVQVRDMVYEINNHTVQLKSMVQEATQRMMEGRLPGPLPPQDSRSVTITHNDNSSCDARSEVNGEKDKTKVATGSSVPCAPLQECIVEQRTTDCPQGTDIQALEIGLAVAMNRIPSAALRSKDFSETTRLQDELNIGAKLEHQNVAKYLGYCIDVEVTLEGYQEWQRRREFLVLGYVPNGHLNAFTGDSQCINGWSTLFRIFQGIAEGVRYLHEQCIAHMDLNPRNILLDFEMNPVIIGFGLSRVLDHDGDKKIVDYLAGTWGYMAPEHIKQGLVSTKCDVFAFGSTIFWSIILASALEAAGPTEQENGRGLARLLDAGVPGQIYEVDRCLKIATLCMESDPADRPIMEDVLNMLNGKKKVRRPKNPIYSDGGQTGCSSK